MSKIDLIITNERALVVKSTLARFVLDSYLSYSVTKCKIDKFESRLKKKTCYKWDVSEHTYRMDDNNSPFYTISRGLAELLPSTAFNKIYETTSNVKIPDDKDLSDEDIRDSLNESYRLRPDQIDAVRKSLKYKRGINQLATGSGKSIIICSIIKLLIKYNPDIKVLLILPYEHLQKSFSKYFELFNVKYSYPTKIEDDSNVIISSAISMLNRSEYLSMFNVVLYDECQHLQADTWNELSLMLVNAEVALGFSAEVIKEQNIVDPFINKLSYQEALAIGATGPVISYIPPSVYIEQGILATPILFTISNYLDPILSDESDWNKTRTIGLMDENRNKLVGYVTKIFTKNNRRVLLLVGTHEHSYRIAESILNENNSAVVGISFGGNKGYVCTYLPHGDKIYNYVSMSGDEVIEMFRNKDVNILIGTSHLDEGVDLPDLDVCILVGGGKVSRRLIQKVGRSLRITKTGKYAYLVDFEDNNSKVLNKHYKSRLYVYENSIGITYDRSYKGISIDKIESIFNDLEEISK